MQPIYAFAHLPTTFPAFVRRMQRIPSIIRLINMAELKSADNSRIVLVDILRGFALLGIIAVHMAEQYYAGAPPESHQDFNMHGLADQIVAAFVGILVVGKFYMIFSFLFGLSFFLQLSKSDGSASFTIRFLWRLIILFGIGMVHHLHYRGDILGIYALLGVGLLLLYRLPDKVLLLVALLLIIDVPAALTRVLGDLYGGSAGFESMMSQDPSQLQSYWDILKSGAYWPWMQANWKEFPIKMYFQIESGRLYITLGLFLLGYYAGKKRIFESPESLKPLFKRVIRVSLWTLGIAVMTALLVFGVAALIHVELPGYISMGLGGLLYDVFNAAVSALYVSAVTLAFLKPGEHPLLMAFYPAGRMGLTTYLMQTVMGVVVFYGIGLNQLGTMGAAWSVLIGMAFFLAQLYVSQLWLNTFRYGPVEWLWRSLTYLRLQPLSKPKKTIEV